MSVSFSGQESLAVFYSGEQYCHSQGILLSQGCKIWSSDSFSINTIKPNPLNPGGHQMVQE